MRRVVSVWFPHWPTDRLRRHRGASRGEVLAAGTPLVTALHDGRRRVLAAVDQVAARLGLRPGLAVAQALAMVPGLDVAEAESEAEAGALHRLAAWCQRYTPLVSPCPPDGLWLDIGGSAHLFGGEVALLSHLVERLGRDGLQARGAVADTHGAAHALARHGAEALTVVAPGAQATAVAELPVRCLRLAPELETTLRRLGFEEVRHLVRIPRALLARRFGPLVGLRLDQAQGAVQESLVPLPPPWALHRRETFLEPLSTAEALAIAIARLVGPLCAEMEAGGVGARRLDLLFERIDNQVVALRIGTVRPSRDAGHLVQLLGERLDTVEAEPGVEAMQLVVGLAEPLGWEQQEGGAGDGMGEQAIGRLVDRLSSRLGDERVYCAAPMESPVPEGVVRKGCALEVGAGERRPVAGTEDVAAGPRLVLVALAPWGDAPSALDSGNYSAERPGLRLVPAVKMSGAEDRVVPAWQPRHDGRGDAFGAVAVDHPWSRGHGDRSWPGYLMPPARLLAPPRPVLAMAALPDEAPIAFTWRRRHKVLRSEGPERVHETWWDGDHETDAVRDYFQVEVESGQRFWLFRRGDGLDPGTGDLAWFLHGVF